MTSAKQFIWIIVISLFTGAGQVIASSVSDSLQLALQRGPDANTKLKIYYQLIRELCDADSHRAIGYAKEMAAFADSVGDKRGKARAMNAFGNLYLNTGDYKRSLAVFFVALHIYEEQNDTAGLAAIHNGLGNVYSRMHNIAAARGHYIKAIRFYEVAGAYMDAGQTYVNLGSNYQSDGDYVNALRYLRKGVDAAEQTNNKYGLCVGWTSLGEAYFDLAQLDSCKKYMYKVIGLGCNDHIISCCYNVLGNVYVKEQKWNQAMEMYRKGIALAQRAGVDYLLPPFYKGMSEALASLGRHEEALEQYRLYHEHNDSLVGKDRQRAIAELQAAFDLEKKDRQIESLESARKVAELQGDKNRQYRNSFIIAFILAVFICVVFMRNAALKQKMNRTLNRSNAELSRKNIQIGQQKNEIEKINAELARYNKEIVKENTLARYEILKGKTSPHFLFNSLTSLSALVIRDKDLALEFIERFSDLYRTMLEMDDSRLITLKQEMELVSNYLFLEQARFRDNLKVELDIAEGTGNLFLPSFAVQLCVENALKHNIITDADKLTVRIRALSDRVEISNNLQKKSGTVVSTATGHKSIIGRYKLLSELKPEIKETSREYSVTLPLLQTDQIGL